ncbi:MAG: nuclear transport factor 2 family protein [Pseudomonadota bacterium]
MSQEKDNVAILKDAYRRWHETRAASVDLWMDLMTDDIDFRSLAHGSQGMEFTKDCCSKDQVRDYFQGLTSDWEMIYYNADEFVAQDNRVVMIGSCSWRHRKNGNVIDTPKVDIFRMRDGKITAFFELYDTASVIAAAT